MDMPHSALITDQWLTIWSYVPTDFSVPIVSVHWKTTWARLWATLSSLSFDFRNSRIDDGDDEGARAVALARWSVVANRVRTIAARRLRQRSKNLGRPTARPLKLRPRTIAQPRVLG